MPKFEVVSNMQFNQAKVYVEAESANDAVDKVSDGDFELYDEGYGGDTIGVEAKEINDWPDRIKAKLGNKND